MVFYICNRQKPECKLHTKECFDCKHTTDPHYAKNGTCAFPEKHPERFEAEVYDVGHGKTETYYWEKESDENDVRDLREESEV